jgi:FMN reductase
VLRLALDGAASRGAETKLVSLADEASPDALDGGDAFLFGSPVYRASYTGRLKTFLDATQRGMWGEEKAPLQARACGIVFTGADQHHFLALDGLRNVLAGFFAAHVVSPGLYVPRSAFGEDGAIADSDIIERAHLLGRSVVDLATAIAGSAALAAARPQV